MQDELPLYRIVDWDKRYENNRTRGMKIMQWVPVPNSQDGDGFTYIMSLDDGASIIGAWLLILQVASKCRVRGTLLRDNGTHHAPCSIARITRCKQAIIERALEVLCSDDVGWVEVIDSQRVAGGCGQTAGKAHPTDYGTERNGTEEKEREKEKVLSVERFEEAWKLYGRYGVKKTSLQYWLGIPEKDQQAILVAIPKYLECVANGRAKSQFEGWINPRNRKWDVDWSECLKGLIAKNKPRPLVNSYHAKVKDETMMRAF